MQLAWDDKLQHDINRGAAKIWALTSGKIDKYEHLKDAEILFLKESQMLEQTSFTYSPINFLKNRQKRLNIKKKKTKGYRVFKHF